MVGIHARGHAMARAIHVEVMLLWHEEETVLEAFLAEDDQEADEEVERQEGEMDAVALSEEVRRVA